MVHKNNQKHNYAAQPHVLVVDDDERIRDLISRFLQAQNFVVMTAADAVQARDMLKYFVFDVLVVDIMMPGETGLSFTKSLQGVYDTPVLLLTALGEADDRISGLEHGADDYLTKPFEPRELVLRLQAIIRRTAKPDDPKVLKIGRWVFDPAYNELRDEQGTVVPLTTVEVTLINALAGRAGQVMSREALAAQCNVDPDTRNIDVQVARLRRKIEENTRTPRYLQTVRGKGYLLRLDGDV